MPTAYEYLVCQMQMGRITFVNGEWRGSIDYRSDTDPDTALNSCPQVWEYLNRAGAEGWELVGAVDQSITHLDKYSQVMSHLYLKRASY